MKVIEHIHEAKAKKQRPLVSYEIVPPPRGSSIKDIIDVVEVLAAFHPPWIDVTSHSSVTQFHERADGSLYKRTVRKRPGTLGICGIIQNRFKIDTVAHILCQGFTKEETEDALIELSFLGIHNCLALRGDRPPEVITAPAPSVAPQLASGGTTGGSQTAASAVAAANFEAAKAQPARERRVRNKFAADLVRQIKEVGQGQFLDELTHSDPLDFCVGVAGYPEKHFEAPSLKVDIQNLKAKVEAGADYIMTQMFFDSADFFKFEKACREAGIHVPIIPGLKVLKSATQLRTLPKAFSIDLPDPLVDEVMENPNHAAEIGERWALKQASELIEGGVDTLHFYVLNDADLVARISKKLLS